MEEEQDFEMEDVEEVGEMEGVSRSQQRGHREAPAGRRPRLASDGSSKRKRLHDEEDAEGASHQRIPYSPNKTRTTRAGKQLVHPKESLKMPMLTMRRTLKAKRSSPTKAGNTERLMKPMNMVFVMDTNILVDHLAEFKSLMGRLSVKREDLKFVIPWIVLQELDGLKQRMNSIKSVIKFINEQFKAQSLVCGDFSVLIGDNSLEVKDSVSEHFSSANNDDQILKRTLQIERVQQKKNMQVFLVTEDVNMSNKALSLRVKVVNWREMIERFTETEVVGLRERIGVPPKDEDEEMLTDQSQRQSQSETKPCEFKPCEAKPCDKFGEWLSFRYSAEKQILAFIEKSLRREYGDKLWDKMFDMNLKSFTIRDAMRILRQGWIGIFGEVFDRNREVKRLVDDMFTLLREEQRNCAKLHSLLSNFVRFLGPSAEPKAGGSVKRKKVS